MIPKHGICRGWKNLFVGYDRGLFYFRIFGYGLWFASYKSVDAPFSERNGYYWVLRMGNWRMKVLHRGKQVKKQTQETETTPGVSVQ